MHPVAAHALDVASVSMLLPRPTQSAIPRQTLGFLVALHDIGKLSRGFQSIVPAHWPIDVLGPPPAGSLGGPRHDLLGYRLLMHDMEERLDAVLPPRQHGVRGWTEADLSHLVQALAGHHGRPVAPGEALHVEPGILSGACKATAQSFVEAMLEVFRPTPLPLPASRDGAAQLGWDLAGVVTLADWVGSRQAWFPYVPASAVSDPSAYLWNHALPRAATALAASGLSAAAAAPFGGVRRLFPGITLPSPVQAWAEAVPLPPGPVLAVIEDVTGSGKTEAAVTLAHRLLASSQAAGVFLALPTMATANAMFGRMADAYRGLFADDAQPSLVLAHGRAGLDPRFATVMQGGPPQREAADPADTPAEAHCAAWLAEDRRRALLAQFGVGTIDQAIMAVAGLFAYGRLVAVHCSERTGIGAGGSAAARVGVDHPVVREHIARLGAHLGWHGGLTLDYLHVEGVAQYIECNPRTVEPGNAAASGVDLPRLTIAISRGEKLPEATVVGRPGHRTHNLPSAELTEAAPRF